jgi:hypothetical protein
LEYCALLHVLRSVSGRFCCRSRQSEERKGRDEAS